MKVVCLGATHGMGRAIAQRLAERGEQLFLLGRDPDQLQGCATDLELRGAHGKVGTAPCDLLDPAQFTAALDAADLTLDGFDTVIVTAGLFAEQADLERDSDRCRQILEANFSGTVLFCETARKRLIAHGDGTLCVFSSVAGDRGRKPVILYGSAKAGLSSYLEGLDHKYSAEGLKVLTVKPGFVKTGMTAGLKPPPFAGRPEDVARLVIRAIDRGRPVVLYAPPIWRYVMLAIRNLPRFIMRRIGF
jgi:decaprenylphospho-beta-D-erythro-pentofuranosid-2-ulose 2-reductase